MYHVITQAIGFVGTGLEIGSYQCKSSRKLIFVQLCGNTAFLIHMLMLGAAIVLIGVVLVAQQEHKRNNITLDSHDYLHMLHKGETEGYAELYREYEKKYYLPLRSLIKG